MSMPLLYCKEKGCDGKINMNESIDLPIGCGPARREGYPCKKCGRLHWKDGEMVFNKGGNKAFLEAGQLVIKDDKGVVIFRF